jgi:general secretion pathway protein G
MLLIVAIVGILVTMAVPNYRQSTLKAREAVLTRDLFTVRDLLDQHRADKGKYPASLKDLVASGYLRAVPLDPFTRTASSWQEINEATEGGIFDIHSGSDFVGTNGVPYNQW